MTDTILIGISIAGGIITVVGALIGLGYNQGVQASRTRQNTADIAEIKAVYVVGLKDVNDKLDLVLAKVNNICERVSTLEGRLGKG